MHASIELVAYLEQIPCLGSRRLLATSLETFCGMTSEGCHRTCPHAVFNDPLGKRSYRSESTADTEKPETQEPKQGQDQEKIARRMPGCTRMRYMYAGVFVHVDDSGWQDACAQACTDISTVGSRETDSACWSFRAEDTNGQACMQISREGGRETD